MARRTLRALDSRIIKRTIQAGAKRGVSNISTKDMSLILGITEPTIYVHFGTKDNLLYQAYLECRKSIDEEERNLLKTYEMSKKEDSDLAAMLRDFISLNLVAKEKISYALDYERKVFAIDDEDEKSIYQQLFALLGANQENIDSFSYVLSALRERANEDAIENPTNVYKALLVFLK